MAKIKTLENSELEHLRSKVRARFEARCPGEELREVTFKGAYDELRADILQVVSGSNASVSTQRLRKLFYYTNPAVCPESQMEKASFGKDFLEALEVYIVQETVMQPTPIPVTRTKFLQRERKLAIWVVALASVLLCMSWLANNWFQPSNSKTWQEEFDDVSLEGLQKRGWEILDFDSNWFSKQIKPGALTLYTLPGDYWVKPNEEKKITNMLVKKTNTDEFSVTVKIPEFNPSQNCQHAAVFLFDENLCRDNWIYASFYFYQDADTVSGHQYVGYIQRENGKTIKFGLCKVEDIKWGKKQGAQTIWINVRVENKTFYMLQRANNEWDFFSNKVPSTKLNFIPAYVGIASLQGWTKNDFTPWGADTIPAFFDFVHFEGF